MLDFYFIRHGQTQWNTEKKLQGRTNIALNEQGIAQIRAYQLPQYFKEFHWFSSPLLRARETANILDVNAASENLIIEMNWGDWEGSTIEQLRDSDPINFAVQESLGLDLTPPNGESPRDVSRRVTGWAEQLTAINADQKLGCISHKGLIRAIYALAAHWDMKGKPIHKLDFHCAQHFRFDQGKWSIGELNISLK